MSAIVLYCRRRNARVAFLDRTRDFPHSVRSGVPTQDARAKRRRIPAPRDRQGI